MKVKTNLIGMDKLDAALDVVEQKVRELRKASADVDMALSEIFLEVNNQPSAGTND